MGYSTDDHDLPVVLQAAADVDAVVDAVSFFSRIAVVLPANAPLLIPLERLVEKSRLPRRSRRSPYLEVLAAANADAFQRLLMDLAWSDLLAQRLLVRLITPLPDAGLRFAAIRAFGEAAYMNTASLRPVQSDSCGELYLVGPEPNPLAFKGV